MDDGDGAIPLAGTLASGSCPNLEELRLSGNQIGPVGGIELIQALEFCPNIRHLDMAKTRIGSSSIFALATVLSNGGLPRLSHLDLSSNRVKKSMAQLCMVLGEWLSYLDLSDNAMGVEGAMALGTRLGALSRLEHLNISGNAIGSLGVQALMPSLPPLLQVLDLSANNIDQEAGPAIASRLMAGGLTRLRLLNLADNYLAVDGALKIAYCFSQGSCPQLEVLNLAANAIGELR